MIQFESLSVKNFLSFGNNVTVFNLRNPGTTLILGEDLDNTANGQSANGTGKTTIINALTYGVYGKPISDISLDNLVNNINKKNMTVTVDFRKGSKCYRIVRARKTKAGAAGNWVEFYEREDDFNFEPENEVGRDSTANTTECIERIIGIKFDLFVRIVAFSADQEPFLNLPLRSNHKASQTGIIESLFGLTELSEKADILKKQITVNDLKRDKIQSRLQQIEREHARHNEQLKSAERRVAMWEETNRTSISKNEQSLMDIANIDFETETLLHAQIDDLNKQLLEIKKICNECVSVITKREKHKGKAESELEHLKDDECPYCLQDYADAKTKMDECKADVISALSDIELATQELKINEELVNEFTLKIENLKGELKVENFDELLEVKNHSSTISNKINELKESTNPFLEPLDELTNIELDPIEYAEVNSITVTIEHQQFLLKLLTKRDSFVRKILLNKTLPFLNGRLQGYLNELGLPHKVEFTHELTASISQFGRILDFGNLSNGQRARVNIALSFAFRDVLQTMHTPLNVCILDEVLDVGLDTVGIQSAAQMLKRKARTEDMSLFIISHRDEIDSVFEKTLTIQMSDGFSRVGESCTK